MARQIEDCGTTPRRKLTTRIRLQVWEHDGGRCYRCGRRLGVGSKWHVEHERALELGGEDELSNMRVICEWCHIDKTRRDHAMAAKAKRSKAKHIGAYESRRPMPFGRASNLKRKMDGTIVKRY